MIKNQHKSCLIYFLNEIEQSEIKKSLLLNIGKKVEVYLTLFNRIAG